MVHLKNLTAAIPSPRSVVTVDPPIGSGAILQRDEELPAKHSEKVHDLGSCAPFEGRSFRKMKESKLPHLIFVLFLFALLNLTKAFAEDRYFLNPGLKFGHTFGEKGGYTIGFEISHTRFSSQRSFGMVASIDYCRNANRFRYHLGGEYLAVAVGPTVIVEAESVDFGFNVTPYFGLFVIPYYNHTLRFTRNDLHELGAFLKFPILVKGRDFNLGG
jgi:hypothetical protein